MPAYFSSKLIKQLQAAFAATLLVLCLLGTHWIGFSHSISHEQLQSQMEVGSTSSDKLPSLNHSSDVCHLFDALALAGFIASKSLTETSYSTSVFFLVNLDTALLAQIAIEHYQSRAPPTLLS
ncbi:hypothetical protein [Polynucleobacter ibericus]|uniref:hypothetical protein n=1 Tax=Polynucleobacter ibericus TaxID=1819725 RepID=UPI001BFCD8DA|nr:hypothetical protein [Polynucleobacter ibericus]QWE09531.1 hypothetical protein AOC20_04910 [Polynucleobacter ibericus]